MVIEGDPGSGKSALIADWITHVADMTHRVSKPSAWQRLIRAFTRPNRNATAWLFHFVDASVSSSDWQALVTRLLGELKRTCRIRWPIYDGPDDLRAALGDWLPHAAECMRLVIVLDGIDQIDDQDHARDLVWLPAVMPPGIRLVCTTRPGRTCNEMKQRGWQVLKLPMLSRDERRELIITFLRSFGKELAVPTRELLVASPQAGNPQFLTTILEELRLFGEHEKLVERIQHYLSAQNVEELFIKVLERYEQDYESDRPHLVRDAASLMWGVRRGLQDGELLELLGQDGQPLPRLQWSPLSLAVRQSMVGRSGLLRIAHDDLRRAVVRKFLERPTLRQSVHRRLADYFGRQELSRRSVEERLWQLSQLSTNADGKEQLANALCDLKAMSFARDNLPDWTQQWIRGWNAVGDPERAVDGYIAEAKRLLTDEVSDAEAARAVQAAASLLHSLGYPAAAQQLLELATARGGAFASDADLSARSQLGRTLQMQDKFDEALQVFLEGADISFRRYGRHSLQHAHFQGSIAGVYHQQGRDQEALPLFEQALQVTEKHGFPDDHDVLSLRNNLALTYVGLGRFNDARHMYSDNLRMEEQKFGREAPEIVTALSGLASVELHLGRHQQAIQLEQRALSIRESALGGIIPRH